MDHLPVVEGSELLRDGLAKLASHHCGKRCRATPTSTCTETTPHTKQPLGHVKDVPEPTA